MLSVLASLYTPTLAAPIGSPVTAAGQKRAGKLTHQRGDDRCEPARALEGWREAAGVRLRGRSNRRLGLEGRRAPRWRPCAATASGRREQTEPEGGRVSQNWESSRSCNFHALICMSFAWSSRNGPDTLTPRPLPLCLGHLRQTRSGLPPSPRTVPSSSQRATSSGAPDIFILLLHLMEELSTQNSYHTLEM